MIAFRRDRYQPSSVQAQAFRTLLRKARSVVRDEPHAPGKGLRPGLLAQIRDQTFTQHSDRDLRDVLDSIKQVAQRHVSDDVLATVFALVAEVINRRLGAWRIFESGINGVRGLEACQQVAARILRAGDYKTLMGYHIDENFLESESFDRSLTALLSESDLDDDEETIIKTIVYTAEKSKVRRQANILLPARFYQAMARKDTDGTLGLHVTDEQVLAGVLLYQGNVVELNSGEGKTIAAAFPAVLHAVLGNSLHVITANDYLAARDRQLLAPVYESLGITVDVVLSHLSDEERRDAYTKQIVYGTIREFGFDFLRDNIKSSLAEQVQRTLDVAIVDEVDHALIDEATTPMIIAGEPTGNRRAFAKVKRAVEQLIAAQDRVARGLEDELSGSSLGPASLHSLLARLLMAQPDNSALRHRLGSSPQCYKRVQTLIDRYEADYPDSTLTIDLLYVVDPKNRFVTLTEKGQDFLESRLGQFFDAQSIEMELSSVAQNKRMSLAERRKAISRLTRQLSRHYNLGNQVYQMLRAYLLLKVHVDYMVTEDSIVLIDRYTGRPRPDSRYQQGLQAALEAKEGVTVQPECEVLAQVSVRGFVSQYRTIVGMTGTALGARDEFLRIYGLGVAVVPPNQPSMRVDLGHKIYATQQDKLSAIVDEVIFCQQVGRPVLVGTLTVEQSEELSHLLDKRGVRHNLLNAVHSHEEAQIVKEAGVAGAVTVATNMAGRGTDIILDPDLSSVITGRYVEMVHQLHSQGFACVVLNCHKKEEADILWSALSGSGFLSLSREKGGDIERLLAAPGKEQSTDGENICLEFGLGLYVIGTELNHSGRIDLQLKGRSGRQGEFGLSRTLLSIEDKPLLALSDGESAASYPSTARKVDPSGRAYFAGKEVDRQVESAQKIVESESEARRCLVQDYASVLDSQTLQYYRARQQVIESPSIRDRCVAVVREQSRSIVARHFPEVIANDYSLRFDGMVEELQEDYYVDCSGLRGCERDEMTGKVGNLLADGLERMEFQIGEERFAELAKLLMLRACDQLWREHTCALQELMLSIQHGAHSHNSTLSEYTIRAFREWRAFHERVNGLFLSTLMTFPISDTAIHPVATGELLECDLAEDIALVLI